MRKEIKRLVIGVSIVMEKKIPHIVLHVNSKGEARLPGYKPGVGTQPLDGFGDILAQKLVGCNITHSSLLKNFSFQDKKSLINCWLTEIEPEKGENAGMLFSAGKNILLIERKLITEVIEKNGISRPYIHNGKKITPLYLKALQQYLN